MTCALVPLIPNDGHPGPPRPARRRPRHRPRSAAAPRPPTSPRAATARPRAASPGSTPCRSASTILITPATPAAAWACPMLDFTDPSHSGRSGRPVLPVGGQQRLRLDRVAQRGPGPVRLHRVHLGRATARRWPARPGSPAAATARSARSARWTPRPGSPRCPRTTASTRCPLRRASDSRSSTSTPAPSAQPVPSAAAANDLHRPSGGQPPLPGELHERRRASPSPSRRPPAPGRTPPTAAPGAARCSATSDDEHAVSTVTAGPSRPSAYDTRPEITLAAVPVSRYPSGLRASTSHAAYP